jgi:hypothetical protein
MNFFGGSNLFFRLNLTYASIPAIVCQQLLLYPFRALILPAHDPPNMIPSGPKVTKYINKILKMEFNQWSHRLLFYVWEIVRLPSNVKIRSVAVLLNNINAPNLSQIEVAR